VQQCHRLLFHFIVDDPRTDVEKASTKWGSSQLYHMLHFVGSSSKNKLQSREIPTIQLSKALGQREQDALEDFLPCVIASVFPDTLTEERIKASKNTQKSYLSDLCTSLLPLLSSMYADAIVAHFLKVYDQSSIHDQLDESLVDALFQKTSFKALSVHARAMLYERWPVRLVEYIVEIALQCFTELDQHDTIQSTIVTASVSSMLENDDNIDVVRSSPTLMKTIDVAFRLVLSNAGPALTGLFFDALFKKIKE